VEAVVTALMTGGESGDELPGRRVLINPREMKPNPAILEDVWQKLLSLPSQTLPKRQARPVKRLTALAHELAADGLLPDAGKKAHAEMHKVLDGVQVRYAEEIKKAREAVLTLEGKTIRADIETKAMSFDDFIEAADYAVIEDAYKRAGRMISPDLATTYSEHLASKAPEGEDPEEALIEAHTVVAAIGLVSDIKEHLENEAEKLSNQWLNQYRVAIKSLSDERQEIYRQIREMSSDPLDVDLARPNTWLQPMTAREADGTEVELPRFERHMLCDADGLFPESFDSSGENKVLLAELQREGNVAWYRNPARASQDSLGVTYEEGGETKIVRPDFIFFARLPDGSIVADIVDPHGSHLADALPKLQGLARYAETNAAHFRRIEAVTAIGNGYKVLDLSEPAVRAAIRDATNAKTLYESSFAAEYLDK
jgi:type III restriction enzyme